MTKTIDQHEGSKYKKRIIDVNGERSCYVDVYAVLEAFGVTCPARAHAVKKLLCCGSRGKGGELDDLLGVEAAVSRAIEIQKVRDKLAQPMAPAGKWEVSVTCEARQTDEPATPAQGAVGKILDEMLSRPDYYLTEAEWTKLKQMADAVRGSADTVMRRGYHPVITPEQATS